MADAYAATRGDQLSTVFWERLGDGEFVIQRCRTCATVRFPPTSMCPSCHGIEYEWIPVAREGTVWTYTVVHRAPSPDLEPLVPYALAVVALPEGPLVLGRVAGADSWQRVDVGEPVTLVIDRGEGSDPPRYHFELAQP